MIVLSHYNDLLDPDLPTDDLYNLTISLPLLKEMIDSALPNCSEAKKREREREREDTTHTT
jgi:hypothetical protein